jgi:hypothetical protein
MMLLPHRLDIPGTKDNLGTRQSLDTEDDTAKKGQPAWRNSPYEPVGEGSISISRQIQWTFGAFRAGSIHESFGYVNTGSPTGSYQPVGEGSISIPR